MYLKALFDVIEVSLTLFFAILCAKGFRKITHTVFRSSFHFERFFNNQFVTYL